jgi:hypothetical protein
MTATRIRNFLISLPKPACVRVFVDGEPQDIKTGGRSWMKLAETVDAMAGEQLQCLDAEGKVLRAMRLDDGEAQRSDAAAIPAGLAADPHALMLTHFANLVHRAYEHSTELAFNKMVECFDRVNDRSVSIEQRLERAEAMARRLREDQVQDAFERAEEIAEQAGQTGNDAFVNALGQAFVSGQMNRGAAAAGKTNGKANGAGKVNGAPAKGGSA